MNRIKATIDSYVKCYDSLKLKGRVQTNSFFNIKELQKYFEEKECEVVVYDNSFFLLIPFFSYYPSLSNYFLIYNQESIGGSYYEVQYYSLSLNDLSSDLKRLADLFGEKTLKLRLITRDPELEESMNSLFENVNFKRQGRLIRLVTQNDAGITTHLDILKEMISAIPTKYQHVGYAVEGEEQKIFDFLLTEFDPVIDSLPELDEILDNLKKKQIIVVRDDEDNIVCLRYFTVERGVCNLIYELTHKDLRKLGLIYQIIVFFTEEKIRNKADYRKVFGWRNAEKTNLLKFSKSMKEVPDGTVISVFCKE